MSVSEAEGSSAGAGGTGGATNNSTQTRASLSNLTRRLAEIDNVSSLPCKSVHSGWLNKRSDRTKQWKRRWFVLDSNNCLAFYKQELSAAESSSKLEERGPFLGHADVSAARRVTKLGSSSGRDNCFRLDTDRGSWLLSAKSSDDLAKWLNLLEERLPPPEDVNVHLEGVLWKMGKLNKVRVNSLSQLLRNVKQRFVSRPKK